MKREKRKEEPVHEKATENPSGNRKRRAEGKAWKSD